MTSDDVRIQMASTMTEMVNELRKESDRGSVIVAIAWLEEDLTGLLCNFVLPTLRSHQNNDELFGMNGCVASFSAKIDIAYRLGLVRESVARSLHLCRRIRNDFAHQSEFLDFSNTRTRDRVSEIYRLNEVIIESVWESAKESLPRELLDKIADEKRVVKALKSLITERELFEILVGTISAGLVFAKETVVPLRPLDG